jgi:hypothetical protein
MDARRSRPFRPLLMKALAFLAVFVVLHFAYDWLPSPFVAVFSGTNESFVQHAKIGFWSYSLVCVGEYLVRRKRITTPRQFAGSRLLSTIFLPWTMFLLWYSAPELIGRLPGRTADILYSNIVSVALVLVLGVLEWDSERAAYSRATLVILVALYILSAALLVAFTYRVPVSWADFFR